MISSIRLNGCHKIGITNKKVKIGETVLNIEKEIPFVRYKFNTYTETEIAYIKDMKQKFNKSTHLVEVRLGFDTTGAIRNIKESTGKIAVFVYMDVEDSEVEAGELSDDKVLNLNNIDGQQIDRLMLVDKTSTLDAVTAKSFIKKVSKITGIAESNIGICSSPLSFGELACLTAVKAREIMSKYSEIADVALPSANHQNLTSCGCIRFIMVTEDIPAPPETTKGKTKKNMVEDKTSTEDSKPKAKKVKKNNIMPGVFNL
jgi:hypothetical protein